MSENPTRLEKVGSERQQIFVNDTSDPADELW